MRAAALIFFALCALPAAVSLPPPPAAFRADSRRAPAAAAAAAARAARPAPRRAGGLSPDAVLVFTRFNCYIPECSTTALDVVSIGEHYEPGRPFVLATLIEPIDTSLMNFYAYSAFDNATRLHYTVAARSEGSTPLTQLFTVAIAANGTAGALVGAGVVVDVPEALPTAEITAVFTAGGLVYIAFGPGVVLAVAPATGAIVANATILPQGQGYADTLSNSFDAATGIFWATAQAPAGYFLHSWHVGSGATTLVGPLPATPGTGAGPNGERVDEPVASMAVYPPPAAGLGANLTLMELRTSPVEPWIFMAWLNPATGASTLVPLPSDWWQDYDIDPDVFPGQWAGSKRRVWAYDPVDCVAWFKLYDECNGVTSDCDENETIVYLDYFGQGATYWYVEVEPVEPELTQMIWVSTSVPV